MFTENQNRIFIYDTTLRDGAQGEGISFTLHDKMKICEKLDEFGVDFIEAGNPGSNPKDMEFFYKLNKLKFKNSTLVAFGSTRKPGIAVETDNNVLSLLKAETSAVAIFGKSWDLHVTEILKTNLEENLNMIRDTITFMKNNNKEVIFDAEHFFDGYKANPSYAMKSLEVALEAGASWLVLCDTNGGSMPYEIQDIIRTVVETFDISVGIHCHNDSGVAVANSIMAIENGAIMLQGTFNGYGERCGNANLSTLIPNLILKLKKHCNLEGRLKELTGVSRYVSEIANMAHDEKSPYVGNSSFAHKGGMHIDAVLKLSESFEHIQPNRVGNDRRILMSEVSGRSTVVTKIQKVAPWITKESIEVQGIIDRLKQLEYEGYQFEGADSSFELLVRRMLGNYEQFFEVKDFRVNCEDKWKEEYSAYAVIKVAVGNELEVTAAEGDGPVNAMDGALRKALMVFYPSLSKTRLTDYKVRVLDTTEATAAKVRVHIESTDGEKVWGTVGVSTNIIEASWYALVDSLEYFLYEEKVRNDKTGRNSNGDDNDSKDFGSTCRS